MKEKIKRQKKLTKDGNLKYFSSTNSSTSDSNNTFAVEASMQHVYHAIE